jgi:hypothetical protein
MSRICLPEQFKIVEGISNLSDTTARTSDYVSLKNCRRATAVCTVLGGAAAALTITPYQATDVSNSLSDEKAIANVLRWWLNDATATSDTLVAQTAAVAGATAATAANHMLIMQFDPAQLDVDNGFDCICVKTSGASASNLVSVVWFLETDFAQATPPTAITD